jgi:hypothetical protein
MRFFASEDDHPIEKAYSPEDFQWENVGYSTKKLLGSMRRSFLGTFVAVIVANLIQLSMMAFKTYLTGKQSGGKLAWYLSVLISATNVTASILTAASNLGLIIVLAILSVLEKHLSKSQWVLSFTRKLVFFQFINTTLVAIAINISPSFFGGNPNLREYIYNTLFANIFIGPLMHLLNPFHLFKLLRKRGVLAKIKNSEFLEMNQKDLNGIFEFSEAGINARYSAVVRTFFLTCFFFEIVPSCVFVCVVYLFVQFWVDKYMLLRQYQKSPRLDPQLGLRIGELAESSMFLMALGRVYSRLQTSQKVHSSDYLCLFASCALCFTPLLGYAIKLHLRTKQRRFDQLRAAKGAVAGEQDEELLGRKTRNVTNANDDSAISDYNSKTSGVNEKLVEGLPDASEEVTYEQLYLDFPSE